MNYTPRTAAELRALARGIEDAMAEAAYIRLCATYGLDWMVA